MSLDLVIDRSPRQKANRVDALRAELKELGYSVISTRALKGLLVQTNRIVPMKRRKRPNDHD